MIQNLSVHFAGTYLFDNISFRVNKGDRIGLTGKNGAGKSTLLKIMAKDQEPSEGFVSLEGDVTIGYLSQDLEFEGGKTVRQEAEKAFKHITELQEKIDYINEQLVVRTDYESDSYSKMIDDLTEYTERFSILGGYSISADIEKIFVGLGFKLTDFERLSDEFSGGWRMRIELAKLLLQKHDILLLDEPTNHLDIDSIIWLEEFLQTYVGAVILISHDRQFLDAVTTRTIEISNKTIHDYKTNYSNYLIKRLERREKLVQSHRNQEKQIKHTEDLINKFKAKASKATMAQSLMKKLDKVERIELDNEDVHRMKIRFETSIQPGKVVFELNNVGKSYGESQIFSNVELFIERGEKIAFVGQNGQGKTTLARAMVGDLDFTGHIIPGHNVQIGYFAQNQADVLDEKKTVLEEAEYAANEETRKRVRDYLGAFLFSGEVVEKKISVLSGGERNRLALCKLLLTPFNVLVMDEPTNHLDIQSKNILKEALKNFNGTLILVSHDREFLDGLTEKVVEFREGKVKKFSGSITEYLEERKAHGFRQIEVADKPKSEVKAEKKIEPKVEILSKDHKLLKNKISNLEKDISLLESDLADMEKAINNERQQEEFYQKYQQKKDNLETKMLEWEKVSEEID